MKNLNVCALFFFTFCFLSISFSDVLVESSGHNGFKGYDGSDGSTREINKK